MAHDDEPDRIGPTTTTAAGSAGDPGEGPELARVLGSRHIQMIAIGGAIGTGLFYGSAEGIGLGGPAIILGYVVCGLVMFLIVRALGEMSVHEPVAGAFSHFAHRYWSPRAGFVSGWNYWFTYVAVSMVELAVVGAYVNFWFPGVPPWLTAAFFIVVISAANVASVRVFGEFEYWFAVIKVVAIIAMIVLGASVVVLGINRSGGTLPDPSLALLWSDGGFFPRGLSGVLLMLVVVMFSYGGTELIGITAGETEDPGRTIPRAINSLVARFLIFYVGSLTVILSIVPWARIDGRMSPFVQIFENAGIAGAAQILNAVVLTAAMSVYNTALYANGRMLHSLAHQGHAPAFLGAVTARGVPRNAILVSTAATIVSVGVIFLWPEFAFRYLLSVALIAGIVNWMMILVTHGRFRRHLGAERVAALAFRLPGGAVSAGVAFAFLAMVVVVMAFSDSYRTAVLVGPVWLLVLLAGYEVRRRRVGRARVGTVGGAAESTP